MQLEDLKNSWYQYKFLNSINSCSSSEILAIIEGEVDKTDLRLKRFVGNLVMVLAIIMICQGG